MNYCLGNQEQVGFTTRHKAAFAILVIALITLAIGVIKFGWYLTEISGLFILMGIAISLISKMSFSKMAESFINGCQILVWGTCCWSCLRYFSDPPRREYHGYDFILSCKCSWLFTIRVISNWNVYRSMLDQLHCSIGKWTSCFNNAHYDTAIRLGTCD